MFQPTLFQFRTGFKKHSDDKVLGDLMKVGCRL